MDQSNESLSLIYRLASARDLDPVYDLYMDEASNPYLTYDPMDRKEFETVFQELLNTNTLFVVVENDEIIASYRLIRKTHRQSDTVYLGGFVIKSSLKGRGIGTKVLLYIKDESSRSGIKRIELTVDLENETAINLYKKAGFEIEGYIRKSYKLSATNQYYDEYLMGLIL